jgi:predicted alternative tryptophan synthase beta-subunit
MESLRFVLPQSGIPTHCYKVVADMPNPPLPLVSAAWLAEMLGTPARIHYKNEGDSPADISPVIWETSPIRKKQSRHHCSICRSSADARE